MTKKAETQRATGPSHSMKLVSGRNDPLLVILDDEADVASTIVTMAERAGAVAISTATPDAFFEAVRLHRPTHIILDLMMPKVDGVMILERLWRAGCQARLIIASGADPRVVDAAARIAADYDLPIVGTLPKPFSVRQISTLLNLPSSKDVELPNPNVSMRRSNEYNDGDIGPEDLRSALQSHEITPHFQPKVSCQDGDLVGFEALARWQRQGAPAPTPDTFVALAEQSGQIDLLTEHVMRDAIDWFADSFPEDETSLALNVSAFSLKGSHVLEVIEHLCDAQDLAIDRIVVEITESGALGQGTDVLNLLTRMRLKGIELSIDDFGVGYSSIEQLARLPYSELKIDKRFVSAVCHSHEARTIVSGIIGMAKGLNLKTVAEGVEDLPTFSYLRDQGCDVAQGYFIARPMTPDSARRWSQKR